VSIARARRIAEAISNAQGYDPYFDVPLEQNVVADILFCVTGQPALILVPEEPLRDVLEAMRLVADVSLIPQDEDSLEPPRWPQTGRGRFLFAFGECRSLASWARDPRCRVPEKSLRRRIDEDWNPEKAISEPPKEVAKTKKETEKPYAEFPLQKHPSGQWCKKILGKLYYFGSGTWQEALERFQKEHDSIRLGKRIVETPTIDDLVNNFLDAKRTALDSHEITVRTWNDYFATCEQILNYFGRNTQLGQLSPQRFSDFRKSLQEGVTLITLGNRIRKARVVWRFAHKSRMVEKPIDLANCFDLPPAKASRRQLWQKQQKEGYRMFDPEEVSSLLEVLENPLRAMFLLGLNCGFGNTDCSELTRRSIDLHRGWVTFPRPKTMVMRDCPLWPETREAVQAAILSRPAARMEELEDRVFLTKSGRAWVKVTPNGANDDAIAKEFSKVLVNLLLKRPGLNFYALRHTFQTVGESAGDLVAVRSIMGHVDNSMSGVYREFVAEERLRHVVEYVRQYLLCPQQ
jgi:integrase